jgi:ribosomal protein S18 acetylase RimI-like enzyme
MEELTLATTVRSIKDDERRQWELLWDGYQEFYKVALPRGVTEATWQRLSDPAEPVNALGAFDGARLVGFVHFIFHRSTWMVENTCYLQDLFVASDARGQGLSRQLISAVYASAEKLGGGQVYWLTHSSNERARRVYDSLAKNTGFVLYERFADTQSAVQT